MTPLELLQSYSGRLREIMYGADYEDIDDLVDSEPRARKRDINRGRGINNRNQLRQWEMRDPNAIKHKARNTGRAGTPFIPGYGPAKPGEIIGPKVQIPYEDPRIKQGPKRPPVQGPQPGATPARPSTVNRGGALVKNRGGALVDTTQRINTNTKVPSGPRGMYTRLPSTGISGSPNPNPTAGGTPFAGVNRGTHPFAGGGSSGVTSVGQTPAGRSVVKSVLNRSAPLVLTGIDAGAQISQGENPYVAGGRAFASMLGGTLGSAGAMAVGGEGTPLDYLTMGGGYKEGSTIGRDLFNRGLNMFGYKPNTPSAQTAQQIKAPEQSTIPPNSQNMVPPAVTTPTVPTPTDSPSKTKAIKGFDTLTPQEMKEAIALSNQSEPVTPKGPRLDPNATERYASNFKDGQTNMASMQDYFKGQKNGENLATWAAQNPALAYKAYTKGVAKEKAQDQRDLMSDYRVMNQDVSKGEGFNKAEFDAIEGDKGGSVEVDIDGSGVQDVRINPQAQAFKDNAQMSLINTLNNPNITPIVEGMELPDMSKYAGTFNQTDAPDYKTMMKNAAMGQLAENLGLSTKGYDTSNYFDRMFRK